MKRTWDIDELIKHFTFVSSDVELLGNKTGATRLEFALLLKCFQVEDGFSTAKNDIPRAIIDYVANKLRHPTVLYSQYDWAGRIIINYRIQFVTTSIFVM